MDVSRLVLRMEGNYSVSTELRFAGELRTEDDKNRFREAIKASLGDLIKITRWCHPGGQVRKIEAKVYDLRMQERFRTEHVPITVDKLQERLDAETDAVRPFVYGTPSTFDMISNERRKELAAQPRKPGKVTMPAPGSAKSNKVSREVKKLDKPEDFLAREASS